MRGIWALLICVPMMTGCGGYYVMTVPDAVAPAGGRTTTVMRLQRNDFFVLAPPIKGAAIRMRIEGGRERAAYTDELGYAGTMLGAPSKLGRHTLTVSHQDDVGEEIDGQAAVYVWQSDRPTVAVDLACLPTRDSAGAEAARGAIASLAKGSNILYLTTRPVHKHARAHAALAAGGYADGPVLLWRRRRWHIVRKGLTLPRVVFESRLVSQLSELRKTFSGLTTGVCGSRLAAKAFADAGMRVVVIGPADAGVAGATHHDSWSQVVAPTP